MKRVFNFNGFTNNALTYVSDIFLYDYKFHTSGIYVIRNIITNDCYVGQSIDMKRRIREHKQLLNQCKEKYRNGEFTVLQKAWNKYGAYNFKFDYLEQCEKELLNEREKFWINKLQCNRKITGRGYNLCDGGTGIGNKQTNSVGNLKGTYIVNNGEIQKYINPNDLAYYESIGYTRGLLKSNKEKLKNIDRIIRKGKDHHNYNKTWTKEAREKFNYTIKNRINKPMDKRRPVIQEDINNTIIKRYISITEASKQTGIQQSTIVQCCKGQHKTAGGFKWRYEDEFKKV